MWRSSDRNMWLHAAGGSSKSFCRLRWNCNFTLALMRPGPWGFRKDICCGNCSLSFSFRNKWQTLIGDYIGHKSTNLWNGRHGDCLQVLQCLSDPCRSNQLQSCSQSFRTCGHFECVFAQERTQTNLDRVIFDLTILWNQWVTTFKRRSGFERDTSEHVLPVWRYCHGIIRTTLQQQDGWIGKSLPIAICFPHLWIWLMKFRPSRFKGSLAKANLPHSLYIFITISISPWRVHPKFLAWLSRIHAKCSNVILGNHLS